MNLQCKLEKSQSARSFRSMIPRQLPTPGGRSALKPSRVTYFAHFVFFCRCCCSRALERQAARRRARNRTRKRQESHDTWATTDYRAVRVTMGGLAQRSWGSLAGNQLLEPLRFIALIFLRLCLQPSPVFERALCFIVQLLHMAVAEGCPWRQGVAKERPLFIICFDKGPWLRP